MLIRFRLDNQLNMVVLKAGLVDPFTGVGASEFEAVDFAATDENIIIQTTEGTFYIPVSNIAYIVRGISDERGK